MNLHAAIRWTTIVALALGTASCLDQCKNVSIGFDFGQNKDKKACDDCKKNCDNGDVREQCRAICSNTTECKNSR